MIEILKMIFAIFGVATTLYLIIKYARGVLYWFLCKITGYTG